MLSLTSNLKKHMKMIKNISRMVVTSGEEGREVREDHTVHSEDCDALFLRLRG